MRIAITTRTVRRVLLTTALLLIAVIAAFIGYARYRARHFVMGLPAKLGVDIKQETNGFTYSQSIGGRTVFTVHASKEIQRTDGRITLHDVGITLYGRTPDRADRIHGSEFEYDPANGMLKAAGEVYLDLEAPAGSVSSQGVAPIDSRMIHIKTSGLVFLEKERTANTDQPIEFAAGGLKGSAVGASYDAAHSLFVLKDAVKFDGVRAGHSLALTASHAELDRDANVVRLSAATAVETTATGVQKLSAQQAVLGLTAEGAPRTLEGEGHVILTRDNGGTLSGDHLHAEFGDSGKGGSVLRHAQFSRNVHFQQNSPSGSDQGSAGNLNVRFDNLGRADHADLDGGVLLETRTGIGGRTLHGSRVQFVLGSEANGRSVLNGAEVFGEPGSPARITMVSAQAHGGGSTTTDVMAQHLRSQFSSAGGKTEPKVLDGEGQTSVEQTSTGIHGDKISDETSTGDSLHVAFSAAPDGRTQLSRAEQHGHVTTVRQVAGKVVKGHTVAGTIEHSRADDAVFDATTNHVLLTGAVEVADSTSALFADKVNLDRSSNAAIAEGTVRVSYAASGSKAELLHVTAARAETNQASGLTKFFAAPVDSRSSPRARLWQGGSQIEAAEIDFDRMHSKVVAKCGDSLVRGVLASAGTDGKNRLVRIASRELIYTEAIHRLDLNDSVQVTGAGGSLTSSRAEVFLTEDSPPKAQSGAKKPVEASAGLMSGKVERIVAEGGVELVQPGRKAVGEELVYTAADEMYVLTGTKAAPPRLMDDARGTITGASLRFRSGDDSVEILGGDGQRVQSQTYLKRH